MVDAYTSALAGSFTGRKPDVAEENLQARIRGTMVMALSNKFGWLVVATGNKSELSVGYSTLYGDLAGGFALLKDVFKTDVFRLARWLNERAGRELIPQSIIDRAPSAELRADQRDQDSLPPYDVLDAILAAYVEEDLDAEELRSFLSERVAKWWVPDRIEFIDEVPKTAVGKFRKTALREQFAQAQAPVAAS